MSQRWKWKIEDFLDIVKEITVALFRSLTGMRKVVQPEIVRWSLEDAGVTHDAEVKVDITGIRVDYWEVAYCNATITPIDFVRKGNGGKLPERATAPKGLRPLITPGIYNILGATIVPNGKNTVDARGAKIELVQALDE